LKNFFYSTLGVIAFLWFWGFFLYAAGFLLNLYVPKSIDSGVSNPIGYAVGINTLLIILFGLQHSVMARKSFKESITKILPDYFERSFYVLASNLAMTAMLFFWQPITTPVWSIDNIYLETAIYAIFVIGCLVVVYSLWIIDHFEYIGLRQIYFHIRKEAYRSIEFKMPTIYRHVRHPMYLGTLMVFWSTPHMTLGHLFLALGMTLYTLIGVRFEERDLHALYGETYRQYKQTVGMLFPRIK